MFSCLITIYNRKCVIVMEMGISVCACAWVCIFLYRLIGLFSRLSAKLLSTIWLVHWLDEIQCIMYCALCTPVKFVDVDFDVIEKEMPCHFLCVFLSLTHSFLHPANYFAMAAPVSKCSILMAQTHAPIVGDIKSFMAFSFKQKESIFSTKR